MPKKMKLQTLKVQSFLTGRNLGQEQRAEAKGGTVATLGHGCQITYFPICESIPPGCATDQACYSQEGICL